MTTSIPTFVEAWDTIPRDRDNNDHSRSRGGEVIGNRAAVQRRTYLGMGMTRVDYIDVIGLSEPIAQAETGPDTSPEPRPDPAPDAVRDDGGEPQLQVPSETAEV
jgi:hypothetical protein